jgi:hypothetical protein
VASQPPTLSVVALWLNCISVDGVEEEEVQGCGERKREGCMGGVVLDMRGSGEEVRRFGWWGFRLVGGRDGEYVRSRGEIWSDLFCTREYSGIIPAVS